MALLGDRLSPLGSSKLESFVGILNLLEEQLKVSLAEYVLFEELFVNLLKDQVSLKFLLKNRLDQEHPDLLNANDSLSHTGVVLNNSVEKLPESLGF